MENARQVSLDRLIEHALQCIETVRAIETLEYNDMNHLRDDVPTRSRNKMRLLNEAEGLLAEVSRNIERKPADSGKDTDNPIILWHGTNEWDQFSGTFEEAKQYIRQDRRYENYGYQGGMVVKAKVLCRIDKAGNISEEK